MAVLGVDIGGTFTDFYLWDEGRVEVYKRASSPDDPARSVLAGIADRGWFPDEVVHGSTVATNAVLERRGARVAFVGSAGFRDLLTIGRQNRPGLYELEPRRPPPLVPPERCFEVDERLDYEGRVLRPLTDSEVERITAEVLQSGVESVALCFLFAFLNPAHEERVAAALRGAGLDVSASHEVLPEFREYERASTTALNAYVAPVVRGYLGHLAAGLGKVVATARAGGKVHKPRAPVLKVIQSSGGTATAPAVAALPASTLLSGPAGGVAGAFSVAAAAGYERIITFDMGGTSTDVCLCPALVPFTTESSVGGLPLRLPTVDIHTVGAGGGSLAWVDAGGALRVGPESAGADPGPAAYRRGGPATVTDAQLVLGRLAPEWFLGGGFEIDPARSLDALAALAEKTSQTSTMKAADIARGVISVVNAHMGRALRVVSVERGFDPRDFTLVAFGGAGPLHACELAAGLSIGRVLVPRYPGILSAIGMALADETRDISSALSPRPDVGDGDAIERGVAAVLRAHSQKLRIDLGEAAVLEPSVDLRYAGQGYELTVAWPKGGLREATLLFQAEHQRRFGYADPAREVELVTIRTRGRVKRPPQTAPALKGGGRAPEAAFTGRRQVMFDSWRETPTFDRSALLAGNAIAGPALVTQMDSTTLIPPGWRALVDTAGNLLLESDLG
jgi:N-methylhydantoinase A